MATRKPAHDKPATGDFADQMFKAFQPNETFSRQMQAGLAVSMRTGAAMMRFAGERICAQADFWENVSRCHDLSEVWSLGSKFTQTAMDSYRAEARTLMDDLRIQVPGAMAGAGGQARKQPHANGG